MCSEAYTRLVTWMVVLFCVLTASAGDIIAGRGDRISVDIPEDVVSRQEGAVWVEPGGVLEKVGKGDWTLPPANMMTPVGMTVNVRDGSVTIPAEEGEAPASSVPAETLNKAALWLDPSVICDLDGDGGVLSLRDVRETATSVPYGYLRAVSMTNVVQSFPLLENAGPAGMKCVNFGTYKSGKWMRLISENGEDGAACTTCLRGKIRHLFVIYQIASSQGFVFSVEDSANISFHPVDSAGAVNRRLLSRDLSTAPSQISADCYINGERCDPTVTVPPQKSFMVLEFRFCGPFGSMDGFFNDRNIKDRQGGDCLGEVVVFTNELTEVERIQVGRYLSDRWDISYSSGSKTLNVAKGATVNVPAGVKTGVSVVGDGTVSVSGDGDSVLFAADPDFHGETRLPAGRKFTVRDDGYAYSLDGGDRITVETGLSAGCYSGDTVVRSAGSESDTVVKDGNGTASVRRIPAGVKDLSVEEGTLVISAPYKSALRPGSDTAATMANPGFEGANTLNAGAYLYLYNKWSSSNYERTSVGWTGRILPESDGTYADGWSAFFSAAHENYSKFNYKGFDLAPEGLWAFAFRGRGEIETEIDVPADGTYELSFMIAGHSYATQAEQVVLEVHVGDDPDGMVRHVRTLACKDLGYVRYRCLVPGLKKGTRLLRMRTSYSSIFSALSVDDIRLTLVGESRAGFPVPNGGFEIYSSADPSDMSARFRSSKDSPDGWSLTQVDWCGDATVPSIALVRYGVSVSASPCSQSIANIAGWDRGNAQLFLASAKGAKATTSFTPPKTGLYYLKAKLGEFYHGSLSSSFKLTSTPVIEAAVRIGDGELLSCGTVSPAGRMMKEVYWPEPVLIDDPDEVLTLVVSNTVATSAALIDDLEFVPCREALTSNLLSDGGFETNDKWDLVHRQGTGAELYNKYSYAAYRGFALEYYGYDKGEGLRAISLIDLAGCYQKIRFPVSGRYRLRFITRARKDSRSPTYYSPGAAMRAVLAKGSVTNEIVSLATPTTNFVAHTVFFDVDDVDGEYTFGFEAANDYRVSGYYDRMSFIDDASVVYCGDSFADGCREDIAIPEDLSISVAAGARLVADFTGTHKVKQVRLGGRRVSGLISAATHPDSISGIGMFYVQPKGTCIHLR